MSFPYMVDPNQSGLPSVRERIVALHYHKKLFKRIAENPQVGTYQSFEEEGACYLSYLESHVHQCRDAKEKFVGQHGRPGGKIIPDKELQRTYDELMRQLGNALMDYCTYSQILRMISCFQLTNLAGRAIEAFSKMATRPPPLKKSMQEYRAMSGCHSPLIRAANGGTNSIYGQDGQDVPRGLIALVSEEFDLMAHLVNTWFSDSVIDFVRWPIMNVRKRWHKKGEVDDQTVGGKTISAIAGGAVCTMAIASLIAPIVVLNHIESRALQYIGAIGFAIVFVAIPMILGPFAMLVSMLAAA